MTMNSAAAHRLTGATQSTLDGVGLSADAFKHAFRNHPGGVAVITADAGSGPAALTATSVFSVSAEPPLLVFSVSDASSATPTIVAAETLVVHLLGDSQLRLAKLCATSGVDRFADRDAWDRLATGEPYYRDAPIRLRGRIIDRIPAGSSTLVVVHALDATSRSLDPVHPLVFHNRTWHALGQHSVIPDDAAR